ncbi:hypothetical protein LCGC14_1888900 [marine sediment metagenome]|uniref:Methyltransferase type 11 domain-containing protein n=1 Tax=marine sediment metagenome TaxID=412755 RepID=A0A0F9IY90_9ZZZZ
MELVSRKCPVCNNLLEQRATKQYTREFFNFGPLVVKCAECSITCLNPVMTNEEYDKFYNKDGQKEFIDKFLDVSENYEHKLSVSDYRRAMIVNNIIKVNDRILDIGTGNSNFVGMVKNSTGIDINKSRVDRSVTRGLDVRYCDVFDWNEPMDVVTLFHVLEHITNPIEFMYKIYEVLNKNGILVIEVPNLDDALVSLPVYSEFYYQNAHCTYFTPGTLRFLMKSCGFDVVDEIRLQRYSLNNHLYWLLKRKPGKFKGIEILNSIYSWALKVLRKHDTIFLICRKGEVCTRR